MRRIAAAAAVAVMSVSGVAVVTGAPASADRDQYGKCIHRSDFNRIHRGMTKHRVTRIFDGYRGWFADGAAGGYTRAYRGCLPKGHVGYVTYRGRLHKPDTVLEKRWVNDD